MNEQQSFPSAPPLMAADWSQLPKDLLQLISSKLDSEFYQLRFRSVCSSWRSSIPKNHHHHLTLPSKFPIPSNNNPQFFPLSKRSLFLIMPPKNQHNQTLTHPWLIKIGPDSCDQTHLWSPLSRDKQLPVHFPHVLDFNEHRVIDLGCEFVIGNFASKSSQYSLSLHSLYMQKVVVYNRNVLLTIHVSGKLAIFRGGDERWTIIPEMPMPFDDVCVFNGRPIAVDGTGRTVTVGMDLSLELVAEAVFGGGKKFLVESDGELLLVDKYSSSLDDNNVIDILDDDEIFGMIMERAVRFGVFRLDEKEKKWVEVRNLGDRVLFLGEDCAFSASASDLCIGNENCVIYRDYDFHDLHSNELGIGVFHLDQHRISPFSDLPGSSELFWPPPEWVGLRIDDNKPLIWIERL